MFTWSWSWFRNLKIAHKLALCLGVMLSISVVSTWVAYSGNTESAAIQERRVKSLLLVDEARLSFALIGGQARSVILFKERALVDEAKRRYAAQDAKLAEQLQALSNEVPDPASLRDLSDVKRAHDDYAETMRTSMAAVERGDAAAAMAGLERLINVRRDADAKLLAIGERTSATWNARVDALSVRARDTGIASVVIATLMTAIVLFVVRRTVTAPLGEMTEVAESIARGEVSREVSHEARDEIGMFAESMRRLGAYVGQIANAANAMARGDLDVQITKQSNGDVLAEAFLCTHRSLRRLIAESEKLTHAARDGHLAARANPEGLEGAYAQLLAGLDDTMTAFSAPIDELRSILDAMARRDLSQRMSGAYAGDYAALRDALNQALDKIEGAIGSVSAAADQVATAANEISTGNQSLSQAATEQASAIEEVTSSVQEITSMTRRSATNAQQARELAHTVRDGANEGAAKMRELSEAMAAIKKHADQTARIVKTIDEIAFQTNLLSLNAAVEAARAGDAGKGFAVVAEEVRNLAMRSAEAAKTTTALIQESLQSSDLGVRLNADVSSRFDGIAENVGRVAEVIGEIASTAEHESRGVSQIGSAIDEMSKVTQHNAATTEQSAAASEELSSQAASMRELAGSFRLSSSSKAAAPPPLRNVRPVATPLAKPPVVKTGARHLRSVPPPPAEPSAESGHFPLDDSDPSVLADF